MLTRPEIWGKPRGTSSALPVRSLSTRLLLQLFLSSRASCRVMASESPQVEKTPPRTGPDDLSANPATDTAKRKAEQTNGTQTRTKRNRYISIAWYDRPVVRCILPPSLAP